MKQLIRLTESDLHNIVRQVINEIGYKAATLAAGANMKETSITYKNEKVKANKKQ